MLCILYGVGGNLKHELCCTYQIYHHIMHASHVIHVLTLHTYIQIMQGINLMLSIPQYPANIFLEFRDIYIVETFQRIWLCIKWCVQDVAKRCCSQHVLHSCIKCNIISAMSSLCCPARVSSFHSFILCYLIFDSIFIAQHPSPSV